MKTLEEVKKELTPEELAHLNNHLADLDYDFSELSADPKFIIHHWDVATPLFNYVGPDSSCGCLTQIRSGIKYPAETSVAELTKIIKEDKRIPDDVANIKPEDLEVFLEWQKDPRVLKAQGYIPAHITI